MSVPPPSPRASSSEAASATAPESRPGHAPRPHARLSGKFDLIVEASGPLGGRVVAPPSKNATTRLILAAALADGTSFVRAPATNDDALALIDCVRALGARVESVPEGLRIEGVAGAPRMPDAPLNPGNAGAVLRLLLGTACLVECPGDGAGVRFVTDHADSLGRRPNADLLAALRQLGAEVEGTGPDGRLPIAIRGGRSRVRGGRVRVSGARSSQFLSSLLYLTPLLDGDSEIEVSGAHPDDPATLVSAPLIDQTREALRHFGVEIEASPDGLRYRVPGGRRPRACDRRTPGDWPSAAALLSAVAVAGGMVAIDGLADDAQGERRAKDALGAMGCRYSNPEPGVLLAHSNGELRAIDFDGDLATDAVLALEAAACFAEGTSRFRGIANLRIKECDRIAEPLEQLARVGVSSRHGDDWVEIDGRPEGYEGGLEVDCRGDHRVAQMLAIVATRCEKGLILRGAECVSKSYPGFFEDLARMGVKLRRAG